MGMYHRKHEVQPADKKETGKLLTEEHVYPEGEDASNTGRKILPVKKQKKSKK